MSERDINQQHQRIVALDGVRGLAILLVMLYHYAVPLRQKYADISILDRLVANVFQSGWIGVDLFFVLSGFLITGILYDTYNNKHFFKNFYIRRTLRIFPLYYAVLFIFLIIFPLVSDTTALMVSDMKENEVWYWTYLLNIRIAILGGFTDVQAGYMWSLAVEEQFYLIWPFIVFLFKDRLVIICILLIGLFALFRYYLTLQGIPSTSLYVITFTHLDGLLMGSLLAVFLRTNRKINLNNYFTYLAYTSVLVVVSIFVINGQFYFSDTLVSTFGFFFISVFFTYLVFNVVTSTDDNSLLTKCFTSRTLLILGKYSYALYLFHQPIAIAVQKFVISPGDFKILDSYLPAMIISGAITTVISLILAIISWHVFEKQFLKLKKNFV